MDIKLKHLWYNRINNSSALLLLSYFLIFISIGSLYTCFYELRYAIRAKSWVKTYGKLKGRNNNQSNALYIEYKIGKKKFSCNRFYFSPFTNILQMQIPKTKNNNIIEIFFDPKNPQNAVVSKRIRLEHFLISFLLGITLIAGSFFLMYVNVNLTISIHESSISLKRIKKYKDKFRKILIYSILLLLGELSPIILSFYSLIKSQSEMLRLSTVFLYIILVMWLFLRTFIIPIILRDFYNVHKKLKHKNKISIQLISEKFRYSIFLLQSFIVIIIWLGWFIIVFPVI